VRSRTVVTPALLLRSVDYADADRIVTLLTLRFGKAAFIARGARRSKKRFGGALQALSLLSVEVTESDAQLGTLMQAQLTRSFPRILAELPRMDAAFAALLLVRELSPEHEPDDAVFSTTLGLLDALEREQAVPACVRLCFQVRLLALLGFAPRFDRCGSCGKQPKPGQAAEFDPRLGHISCRDCGGGAHRISGFARGELMRATGADWVSAADSVWPERELGEVQAALDVFVEQRLGRALRATSLRPLGTGGASG
jgi:DNA repair protein RecO (recombination protein O)